MLLHVNSALLLTLSNSHTTKGGSPTAVGPERKHTFSKREEVPFGE